MKKGSIFLSILLMIFLVGCKSQNTDVDVTVIEEKDEIIEETVEENYTGVVEYENCLQYYSDGLLDVTYTGIFEYKNKQYFFDEGVADLSFSGTRYWSETMWKISDGEVDCLYDGVTSYRDKLCYFNGGRVDTSYTGVAGNGDEKWYVQHGFVDTNYNAVLEIDNIVWIIENGMVISKYTGLDDRQGKLIYFCDGERDDFFVGIAEFDNKKWYVSNGSVDKNYNGTAFWNGVMYQVQGGEVGAGYTGVANVEDDIFVFENGVIDEAYNGIYVDLKESWYVVSGRVEKEYTGFLDKSVNEKYIVINGLVYTSVSQEQMLKDSYVERELLGYQMKQIMLSSLADMKYIKSDVSAEFDAVGILLDNLELNPAVSESLENALESALEGADITTIIESAQSGAMSGVASYMEDTIISGFSKSILGFDVLEGIDITNQMNALINPDDTPTVLINAVIDEQEQDINELVKILSQEVLDTSEIYQSVFAFEKILKRESELCNLLGKKNIIDADITISKIKEISRDYNICNQTLIGISELEFDALKEINLDDLAAKIDVMKKFCEVDNALFSFEPMALIENYDIEGFKEVVRTTNGSTALGEIVLGDLIGGIMTYSQQEALEKSQSHHKDYYNKLITYQQDSFYKLIDAKAKFDEKYQAYYDLLECNSQEQILASTYMLQVETDVCPWQHEKEALLNCLVEYRYDMECFIEFFGCIISSNSNSYLQELQRYLEDIDEILALNGYDYDTWNEEQRVRYLERLKEYVDFMEEAVTDLNTPVLESRREITAYRVGFLNYYKGNGFIKVILESNSLTNRGKERRFYNQDGDPMYINTEQGIVYLKGETILETTCNEADSIKLYEEAKRIITEIEEESFERGYKEYAW